MRGGFVPGDIVRINTGVNAGRIGIVSDDHALAVALPDRDDDTNSGVSVLAYGAKSLAPLIVIDPDDREQVERLARLLWPHYSKSESARLAKADITQAALRSLVAAPKPPEPPGLGAVVEDVNGDLWVRLDTEGVWACASDENKTATYWPTIAAVRVLSEGVTND